jgi:hypothetical protein
MNHLHTKTSALVRLVARGADTPEEQEAAECELDIRVPMPEVKVVVVIRCEILRRDALEYHASILARHGCDLEEDDADAIVVRCDPASAQGVVSYIGSCPALRYITHELTQERA